MVTNIRTAPCCKNNFPQVSFELVNCRRVDFIHEMLLNSLHIVAYTSYRYINLHLNGTMRREGGTSLGI